MRKNKLFLLLCSILISSCSLSFGENNNSTSTSFNFISESTSNTINSTISTPSLTTPPPTTPVEDLTKDDLTYLDLFNINNVVSVEINMSTEELQKIQNDFIKYSELNSKSPIYRRADSVKITITIQNKDFVFEYDDVGVRMKGNTSRHKFMDENGNIYSNIHLKLSFEETFDNHLFYTEEERTIWNSDIEKAAREDRKFLKMSKLDLRYNKLRDRSFIKEYYALEMYRAFGIMSQHSNFGKVIINQDGNKQVNYGTYLITEPLSKTFIKRSLDNENNFINVAPWDEEKKGTFGVEGSNYGQLYKASYGINKGAGVPNMTYLNDNMLGVESDDGVNVPAFEIKTNTDNGGDHTLIKNTFSALQSQTETKISDYVDLEYFAVYEAISTFLGCPDDLRNNYNNYALYFRRIDGKMIIIPIDLDRVLGNSREWDPSGHALSETSPFEQKAVGNGNNQVNPLYKKTILNSSSFTRSWYIDALNSILNSVWSTNEHFNNIYNIVKTNYESFEKKTINPVTFSLEEPYEGTAHNMNFKEYLSKKEATINKALGNTVEPPKDDGESTTTPNLSTPNNTTSSTPEVLENLIAGCSIFYFRYTQNWETCDENNLFYKVDDTTYRFDHVISREDINDFRFKVFAAELGSSGYWLRADSNGGMLVRHGNDIIINPNRDTLGKTFTVTVNTAIGTCSWEIK